VRYLGCELPVEGGGGTSSRIALRRRGAVRKEAEFGRVHVRKQALACQSNTSAGHLIAKSFWRPTFIAHTPTLYPVSS